MIQVEKEYELLPGCLRIWPEYYVADGGITFFSALEDDERDVLEEEISKDDNFTLVIDYPLHTPARFPIPQEVVSAWVINDLIEFICEKYKQVYAEEEEGLTEEDLEPKGMCLNRPQTKGKYGIWGHELGDIAITDIIVDLENREVRLFTES